MAQSSQASKNVMEGLKTTYATSKEFRELADVIHATDGWFINYDDFKFYDEEYGRSWKLTICKNAQNEIHGCVGLLMGEDMPYFISYFWVKAELRNRGLGSALFERAVTLHQRTQSNMGVHADLRISNYFSREGFSKFGEVPMQVIHLSRLVKVDPTDNFRVRDGKLYQRECRSVDARVTNVSRGQFVQQWVLRRDVEAKMIARADPIGYGAIRRACHKGGYIIGPFYCLEDVAFSHLYDALVEEVDDDAVIEMKVPLKNVDKIDTLLKGRCTIEKKGVHALQFTSSVPRYNYQYIYSIYDWVIPV